jgi:hypothetical protein
LTCVSTHGIISLFASRGQGAAAKEVLQMEKIGCAILVLFGVCWLVVMIAGTVAAFPFGLIMLLALVAAGLLFAKVARERRANKEDDCHSKNVDE